MDTKQQYELENQIIDKILLNIKESKIWGNDGYQIQIINVLRDTIKETQKQLNK
jgi:hypothetical protein